MSGRTPAIPPSKREPIAPRTVGFSCFKYLYNPYKPRDTNAPIIACSVLSKVVTPSLVVVLVNKLCGSKPFVIETSLCHTELFT